MPFSNFFENFFERISLLSEVVLEKQKSPTLHILQMGLSLFILSDSSFYLYFYKFKENI